MKISNIRFQALKAAVDMTLERKAQLFEKIDQWGEEKPVVFCVNWGGYGDRTPDETRDFAGKLVEAARIADRLTELKIEVVYGSLENDEVFKHNDFRKEYIRKLSLLIDGEMYDLVERMLTGVYYRLSDADENGSMNR